MYKWWKQRHRTGNEGDLLDNYREKSLLEGYWELQSFDDPLDHNEPLDGEETFKSVSSMIKSGRCLLTIKRLFSDANCETWVIRVTTPMTGIVETRFNPGEEVDELTCYRGRATSVLVKPNCNKIVIFSKLKNGLSSQLAREVHPSDPNTLIGTITVKNSRSVAIFKRIMDDGDKRVN